MNDQRSLQDQLDDLEKLAAKNGLYDAQDWLRTTRDAQANVRGADYTKIARKKRFPLIEP